MMVLALILLAAFAALLAFQGAFELRQRFLARQRVMQDTHAHQLGPRDLAARLIKDAYQGLGLEFEKHMSQGLKKMLAIRLEKAALRGAPGQVALAAVLSALLTGFFAAFVLGMGGYSILAAGLGGSLPLLRIDDLARRRQALIRRQLPDALDLLTACVEAGLGFDQAFARVTNGVEDGPLKREMEAAVAAAGLGISRREALGQLAKRCGTEELTLLVASLLQADRRGVPLGPTLRAQSRQLRALRALRAKELAAQAPLKMLFPLMVFILPVVFIVLFGPIVMKWQSGGF